MQWSLELQTDLAGKRPLTGVEAEALTGEGVQATDALGNTHLAALAHERAA